MGWVMFFIKVDYSQKYASALMQWRFHQKVVSSISHSVTISSDPELKRKKATEVAFFYVGNKDGLRLLDHSRHGPGVGLGKRSTRFDFNQIAFFGDAGFVVSVVFL